MEKMLCPRWGFCRATTKCSWETGRKKNRIDINKIYVLGKCANPKVSIISKERGGKEN